jgi:hypothetical protein
MKDLIYWTFYPFNLGKKVSPLGILGNRELVESLTYPIPDRGSNLIAMLCDAFRCWRLGSELRSGGDWSLQLNISILST